MSMITSHLLAFIIAFVLGIWFGRTTTLLSFIAGKK